MSMSCVSICVENVRNRLVVFGFIKILPVKKITIRLGRGKLAMAKEG